MKKTYCDHCGKEIKDLPNECQINISDAHIEKHDLCRTCTADFIQWLDDYFEEIDQRRKK